MHSQLMSHQRSYMQSYPRIFWANKDWNFVALYFEIFMYFRPLHQNYFKENEWAGGNAEDFAAMSDEQAFSFMFPGLTYSNWESKCDQTYSEYSYILNFKNHNSHRYI